MSEHKTLTDPAQRAANRTRYDELKTVQPTSTLTQPRWGRAFRRAHFHNLKKQIKSMESEQIERVLDKIDQGENEQ